MITKETKIKRIEVIDNGIIEVEERIIFFENGEEIGQSETHRQSFEPGEERINEITNARLQQIKDVVWTEKCINDYNIEKAKREAALRGKQEEE